MNFINSLPFSSFADRYLSSQTNSILKSRKKLSGREIDSAVEQLALATIKMTAHVFLASITAVFFSVTYDPNRSIGEPLLGVIFLHAIFYFLEKELPKHFSPALCLLYRKTIYKEIFWNEFQKIMKSSEKEYYKPSMVVIASKADHNGAFLLFKSLDVFKECSRFYKMELIRVEEEAAKIPELKKEYDAVLILAHGDQNEIAFSSKCLITSSDSALLCKLASRVRAHGKIILLSCLTGLGLNNIANNISLYSKKTVKVYSPNSSLHINPDTIRITYNKVFFQDPLGYNITTVSQGGDSQPKELRSHIRYLLDGIARELSHIFRLLKENTEKPIEYENRAKELMDLLQEKQDSALSKIEKLKLLMIENPELTDLKQKQKIFIKKTLSVLVINKKNIPEIIQNLEKSLEQLGNSIHFLKDLFNSLNRNLESRPTLLERITSQYIALRKHLQEN